MTSRHTVDSITSDQLDQLYDQLAALRQVARGYCPHCGRGDAAPTATDWEQQKQRADQAEATTARVRDALASFDGRGVLAPGAVNLDIPTAGEVLNAVRAALDAPASSETGFVPATSQHFADMPRTDADPLVIEPYRDDQNQPRWAFRCWGTDHCDGWLGLGHFSEAGAARERDRHVVEAHRADESARTTAINPTTS